MAAYNPYPPGLGNDQQASQATAAMRQEPWYNAMLKAWGLQNPPEGVNGGNPVDAQGNPAKLSDEQRQAMLNAASGHGIGLNNKYDQIDENGQISEAHHKLKKLLIGAAVGGLALTGLGAAGIGPLAGVFGGAGAAGAGGAAAAEGAGAAGAGSGLTAAGVLGGVGTAISTGSKIAGLLGAGKDTTQTLGAQSAAESNQLANNRLIASKVDQGGPAADQQAFRNAMRAGIVAKMDPNAAPININGHAQTSLVTPENINYAKTLQSQLAARQAAGKSATTFGVPDPTQAELDAGGRAKTLGNVGNAIDTGSKIANLFGLFSKGYNPNNMSGDTGGVNIPGGEFDPNTIYG